MHMKLTLGKGFVSGEIADKCRWKSFLMSEEFEGPHGHCLLEKGLLPVKYAPSACERCAKTFSSGNNLKMHMKASAG